MRIPLFLGVMGGASALSLARGFVVASLLDAASFGTYAVTVALGAFCSIILSAGRVEQTQKTYPRLWAEGRQREVLKQADRTAWVVVLRAVVLGAILLLGCFVAEAARWIPIALATTCLATLTAGVSLYASAHRASLDLGSMSTVGFARAASALICGCYGAWLWSWEGAIAGELVGGAFGTWLSRKWVKALAWTPDLPHKEVGLPIKFRDRSGTWFFITAITAAVPSYLDRFFVAHHWGNEAAGSYGFLMLFVTGANVVTGILVQKLGPQLVQMAHLGSFVRDQVRLSVAWASAAGVAYFTGMLISTFILFATSFNSLAIKFDLEVQSLVLATVLCFLQLGHIIEWVLISRDRESMVSIGSSIYLVAGLALASVSVWLHWSLIEFLRGLVFAKTIHIMALLVFVALLSGDGKDAARSLERVD